MCLWNFTPNILKSLTKDIMIKFKSEYIYFPDIEQKDEVKRVNRNGQTCSVFTTQLRPRRDIVSKIIL